MDAPEVCCMGEEDFMKLKANKCRKRPNRLVMISKDAKKKGECDDNSLLQALNDLETRQLEIEKNLDEDFLLEVGMNNDFVEFLEKKVNLCYGLRPENEAAIPLAQCLPENGICSCVCEMEDFKKAFRADSNRWIHEMVKKRSIKQEPKEKTK